MTCAAAKRVVDMDLAVLETEQIRAAVELSNDIAMARAAFNEGMPTIKGRRRQWALDMMLGNGRDYLEPRQVFMLYEV